MTKARNLSSLLDATGDVVSTALDNVPPSDNASSLTTGTLPVARLADGSITNAKLDNDAKVVRSASAPSTPSEGDLWYDQTNEVLKIYQSSVSNFVKVSAEIAVLSSVTGILYVGQSTNLTLSGSGFLNSNLVVNFLQASDAIDVNVTVTPTNDSSATVTVPSSVYNNVTNGNIVTIKVTNSDGKSSGNQTITASAPPYSVDFLVIGGGGRGGYEGGGGAGGYRTSYNNETSGRGSSAQTALTFTSGTVYTVTIGGGDAGDGATSGTAGTADSTSISGSDISTVSSTGGGGGGYAGGSNAGGNGGCGGGASSGSSAVGSGTANEGYDGGTSAGGGGGAGSAGSTGYGGTGGAGLASTITGSSVTRASGGSGGPASSGTVAAQAGGGGFGTYSGDAGDGVVNTGGGGGGYWAGGSGTAGDGGSGVVILRMPDGNYSGTTTGSPTVTTGVGGTDTVLIFTASGSYTG